MPLSPFALPRFLKQYKKLTPKLRDAVQEQVRMLIDNPNLGDKKKGSISSIRVHKFKVKTQLYLLAYSVASAENALYLYAIGPHENFYRDISKYLKG